MTQKISFTPVTQQHLETLFRWLDEPHMKEFWDNTPEHRQDIELFAAGRPTPSPYFDGCFTYWMCLADEVSYGIIMTSYLKANDDLPKAYLDNLALKGETVTLDFGIGNADYLGKGLAAPTLKEFMTFFKSKVDPETQLFFIDPAENNPRAIHVYEKAGFKEVDRFIAKEGTFTGIKHILMVKNSP